MLSQHKPSTQITIRSHLRKHLVPYFGRYQMREIGPEEVQRFVSSVKRSAKSQRAVKKRVVGCYAGRAETMSNTRFTVLPATAVLTMLGFLCSCSKRPGHDMVPADTKMADTIHFQYAVYMLPVHISDPSAVLHEVLIKKYPNLKVVEEIPNEPRGMLIHVHTQKNVQREYAPPDMESLHYSGSGITRGQAEALQSSKEAFIVEFGHTKENVWTALQTADSLIEEIARKTGGLVWDEETREIFSPDAWHEKRLASWVSGVPDISSQTVIHVYKKDDYVRAITLGMAKVGLPDVVVDEFAWSSNTQVGNLINLFCQSVVEGAVIGRPGKFKMDLRSIKNIKVRDAQLRSLKANSTGMACLSLKQGRWEEGDPKNRLIQLTSDRYAGPDIHAKQERMLSSFFGWEDSITQVRHNEELLEASRKARANLQELHRAFSVGLQPGEFIQVKAPFKTTDGGNEWMWVEITSWKQSRITGLLENEPFNITDLHGGQIVEVREEDVFDYIRQYPDKHREGNTTGEILRKLNEEKSGKSNHAGGDGQTLSQPGSTECGPD